MHSGARQCWLPHQEEVIDGEWFAAPTAKHAFCNLESLVSQWFGIWCSRSINPWNDFLTQETVLHVATQTRCCVELNLRDVRTVTGGPRCVFSTAVSYCFSQF